MRSELQLFNSDMSHLNFSPNFMDITRKKCYINSERSYIIIAFYVYHNKVLNVKIRE
jgi:hypothetical protein